MKNPFLHPRLKHTEVRRPFALAPKLLCLAIGAAGFLGLAQAAAAADPLQLKPGRKAPNLTVAQQMSESFDAGDSYQTRSGPRKLHRLAGKVAVKLAPGADKAQGLGPLTAAGGPLAGYTVDLDLGNGLLMLKAPAEERGRQLANPGALQQAINRARGAVKSANPVFVDPPSGLWMIANEEVIIRLKPETDPVKYFGALWANVRRVGGTPDQFILNIPNSTAEQVLAAVNQHAADPRVLWAEPNFRAQTVAHQVTPNDPLYQSQWSLNNTGTGGRTLDADIDAPEAWATTTGNSSTIIAILDCGVQTAHPDLNANLAINSGEIAGNGIDDDGNGYVDDVNGWDFIATVNNNDPNPKVAFDKHGTAVAGIAAARGNNSIGVAGGAYSCRFLPIRVTETTDEYGGGTYSATAMADAIYYAAGRTRDGLGRWRGADVLSLSLGFPQSQIVDDAFTWAATHGRNERGCPVFVSSGNSASGWVEYTLRGFPTGPYSYAFTWMYVKNGSLSSGNDTVWLDSVTFPGGQLERFEGTTLPTGSGWTTSTATPWTSVQNGVNGNHAMTGWNGPNSRAVRAGAITHNQSSWLSVTRTLGAGELRFWAWVSSELNNDQFRFYVGSDLYFSNSGVPQITTAVGYPASHPLTIAVGASTDCDFRADYSQYGTGLDFVAPSSGGITGVYTTDRTGTDGYDDTGDYDSNFGGTSAAAPLAASVGALLLANDPNLTAAEVRTIMRNSCDQIGGVTYTAGFNEFYGYGRINANRALGVNNHPVVTVPGAQTTPEDSNLAITGISVADVDAGAANVRVTLGAGGNLTIGTTTGLTVTGNGTPSVMLEGALNNLNPALASLTYRKALDGTDTITVTANDLGNTGTGGAQSDSKAIPVTVTFVNDPPHFTPLPPPQTMNEDTCNEVTITVSDEETPASQLIVTASTWYPELIPQANITVTGTDSTRTIRYCPAPNKFSPPGPYGAAPIFIVVQDPQQGTGNYFLVTVVQSVNDAPSFTKGSDQVIAEGAEAQTVANWATTINAGPYETDQAVDFVVSSDAPSLFSTAPTIAANGTLTYTPAAGASGTAVVTVQAHDNGGTDRGGIDTSAPQTFQITVLPPEATFMGTDARTRGNWIGKYGSQGYNIVGDASSYPSYVTVTAFSPNLEYDWPDDPAVGGLQRATNPSETLQYCVHSPDDTPGGYFAFNCNFKDNLTHQLAIYVLDFDASYYAGPRTQKIEILDQAGRVLSRRFLGSFEKGKYLIWNVKGYIQVKVTALDGTYGNAVLSGIFFDPPKPGNPGEYVWIDEPGDLVGANLYGEGESWNWVFDPHYAGVIAHQSSYIGSWGHQHYFMQNPKYIVPEPDDELFCWIYVDPAHPPTTVMLQWLADDGSWWEHRAYWGADTSPWGVNGTASRLQISPSIPTPGQWVRLSVPAYKMNLVGRKVFGMAYYLTGGQATWDYAGTLAALADTDADGLPDPWEMDKFGNLAQTTTGDPDDDGAINFQELQRNADPNNVNTDGDAFSDGDEINICRDPYLVHTDPSLTDSDGDGVSDTDEIQTYGSNPSDPDTDHDGLSEYWEVYAYGTSPTNPDTDGDGCTDGDEVNSYGTNPLVPDCSTVDSDGDGLPDLLETNAYGTDPNNPDTDADGLSDGAEVNSHGTDPLSWDTDGDWLGDGAEVILYRTNPLSSDTDGDGYSDYDEVEYYGTDPLDPDSHP